MSSLSRNAANARNAQLSSGPVTEAGKERSSLNARKHGLTARQLIILPHQQEAFESLYHALSAELAPQGELESLAFDQLVHAAWNRHRCRELEVDLVSDGLDPLLNHDVARKFDRLCRYAAAADRAFSRSLKELRTLQTDRALRQSVEPEAAKAIPLLASIPALVKNERQSRIAVNHVIDDSIDAILDLPMPGQFPRQARPGAAGTKEVA